MKYDAMALSPEDLKVGVERGARPVPEHPGRQAQGRRRQRRRPPGFETRVVPSVRTHGRPGHGSGSPPCSTPSRIKAIRDPAARPARPSSRPTTSLPAVLADLEKDTDTQVLMVQGPPELAKALAEKYPGFDIVVATSPVADPDRDAERLNDGKTLLVTRRPEGQVRRRRRAVFDRTRSSSSATSA